MPHFFYLPFHWRKQKRNEFQNFQTFSQPWPFCCLVSRNYNFLQSLWHQAATRQDELSLADILGVEMKSALSCHNWSFHCDPARLQGLIDSCCRTADSLARGLFFIWRTSRWLHVFLICPSLEGTVKGRFSELRSTWCIKVVFHTYSLVFGI